MAVFGDKQRVKKRILFRADADSTIGFGHVIRCLALLEMVKEAMARQGYETVFVTRFLNPFIEQQIRATGSPWIQLAPDQRHFEQFLSLITPSDIVVLDNYFFNTHYQREIKSMGAKLVCIDDLATQPFVCDVVINHTPNFPIECYMREQNTQLAIGFNYALLRQPFLKAAITKQASPLNLFICYGGADSGKSEALARLLDQSPLIDQIHLVTTKPLSHPITDEKITHYCGLDAQQMRDLMDRCPIGVCPASSLSFECLSSGMLLFLAPPIDNQAINYNNLIQLNLAYPLIALDLVTLSCDEQPINLDFIQQTIEKQKQFLHGQQPDMFIKLFNGLI